LVPTTKRQNERVTSVLERTQGHLFTCDELFHLSFAGEFVALPQKMTGIAEILGVKPSGNIFKRNGKGDWTIAFNGDSQTISHVKGLTYIAILLASPGQSFEIQDLDELATGVNAAYTKGESIPLTTKESLRKIHVRLNEARRELTSATSDRDLETIEARQREIEFLSQEVKRTINRSGKIRDKSELEDMRKRVARSISTAIEKVRKQNEFFAKHLDLCITRGLELSYGPAEPISWVAIN
jgi:Skp family chaperone for outer membrane proteins